MERYARELSSRLHELGWESVLCFLTPPEGEVRDFLALPNVRFDSLPVSVELLRRYRPTILHLHFTPFLSTIPWTARACGVKKIFFTDHGSNPEGSTIQPAPFWKQAIGRVLTAPYSGVVSVSEFNQRMLAGRGFIDPGRVRCIHNGTDLDLPRATRSFRETFGIPRERVLAVQVSWIIPEKGIGDLLRAAELAIREEPDLHIALIGEGAYRSRFATEAQKLGIADHVTWTGLIRDPFTEGVFEDADIVCQMSRWEEAFGLVILEGMIFAKPVLATRVGGIPEIVRDGETGFLVGRGDIEAMADRLVLLARDRALRSRLGDAGRRVAQSSFDLRQKIRELIDWYGIRR
jgi:glycosyltransferase involved in cell wall biosynthesis